jgi:hypothetical protein
MHLTLFLLLAAGPVLTSIRPADQSQLQLSGEQFTNYHRALHAAHDAAKPLLIIMNPGPQAEFVSLSSVRKTKERRELLKKYVVVVIDTKTRHGQLVYNAYAKPKLPHVVVLDKRQEYQIFTTSEELYGQRWTSILTTYRNGVRVVPQTVSTCPYCH